MAYRQQDRIEHLRRLLGENYFYCESVPMMDPSSSMITWVACRKHKTHKVLKTGLYSDLPADAEILAAAQACEGCIADAAAILPPTRWPEGAEL